MGDKNKQAQTGSTGTEAQAPAAFVALSDALAGQSAEARTFSTGSRGFYFGGKVVIAGKRYQASVNLVEIGSKPAKA